MSNPLIRRSYGCAIVKCINANYNADFSHQPRMLPNGRAYATDKALKYLVRNYWINHLDQDKQPILYYKRLNEDMKPLTLQEAYERKYELGKKPTRQEVLPKLLSFLDVRTFGATFAVSKLNISIHGPFQITHGVNRFPQSDILTEQIMSPFKSSSDSAKDADQSTLGTQFRLAEGHFVHGFSLNPGNLTGGMDAATVDGLPTLTEQDAQLIKEGLCRGATYYDSTAKAGVENELLLWIDLKPGSKAVLPSMVNLVEVDEAGKIDLGAITELLVQKQIKDEIYKIELYYHKGATEVINAPAIAETKNLL